MTRELNCYVVKQAKVSPFFIDIMIFFNLNIYSRPFFVFFTGTWDQKKMRLLFFFSAWAAVARLVVLLCFLGNIYELLVGFVGYGFTWICLLSFVVLVELPKRTLSLLPFVMYSFASGNGNTEHHYYFNSTLVMMTCFCAKNGYHMKHISCSTAVPP